MLLFSNISANQYDEDILSRIGLNCFPMNMSIDFTSRINIHTNGSARTTRKEKGAIFSHFMYDILFDKLNYKKNAPNNILLSWGSNIHNETTHNV
jgi:hypothetical protein